jgi:hypothetical protein
MYRRDLAKMFLETNDEPQQYVKKFNSPRTPEVVCIER